MSTRFDFQCSFDLNKCLRNHNLEDHGAVQHAIDYQFMLGVEPYVPFLNGYLKNSMWIHTDIGSGEIIWDCDNKARRLYYGEDSWNWSNGGVQEGGLHGPYWAERYWQDGGREECLQAARREIK